MVSVFRAILSYHDGWPKHDANCRKITIPACLSKGEFKALQEFKADIDITILPADKGRSTVILDTKDYASKLSTLLSDSNTYEMLQKDHTPKFKRADRNYSTMSKGGPNPYSYQTCYLFQKKSPRCMAYLVSTGRMSLYEQLSQAEEASQCVGSYFLPPGGQLRTPHPEQW